MQNDNIRNQCYARYAAKEHQETLHKFGEVHHLQRIEHENTLKAVNQKKQNTPRECFRESQRAMSCPKCDSDKDKAERYLNSGYLIDHVDCNP